MGRIRSRRADRMRESLAVAAVHDDSEDVTVHVLMLVLNDMTADTRVTREASALAEAGHSVTVLALRRRGLPEEATDSGFVVRRVADSTTATWRRPLSKAVQSRRRTLALVEAGVECAPDMVHAHDSDTLVAAARIARRRRAELVYDAHELYPDMLSEFGASGSWLVQTYWRLVERRLVPRASAVITVSGGLAAELARRFGVSPAIVRNVPPLRPVSDRDRLRGELDLADDPRVVLLYQGVLIKGRGLGRLLEAMTLVDGAVLVIQGFGPLESSLKERAGELGLGDRVRFMGRRAPGDLHAYACGADVGVVIYEHTTLNNYLAGPNKLYAYLMAGLPVAASAFPGLEEVVERERVGLTFEPSDASSIADALNRLSSSVQLRAEFGERARALAESRYNWDRERRVLIDLYARIGSDATHDTPLDAGAPGG